MSNDNLVYTHGFVARPEVKETPKGKVFTFGLGRAQSYEEDAPVTWINVEVWNEDLQAALIPTLDKGNKVAVVGFLKENEYQGKTYRTIRATQVGLVNFVKRGTPVAAGSASSSDPEDLGF